MATSNNDKNGSSKETLEKEEERGKDGEIPQKAESFKETVRTGKAEDLSQTTMRMLDMFQPRLENMFIFVLVIVIALILGVFYISTPGSENEMKSDSDLVKIFGDGVDKLQQSFTNQTERFWNILKNRGLAHLKSPSQRALVFLLGAPPPAYEWVDCLATKLAEKLDPKQERNLAVIDGTKEKIYPADEAKKRMDEFLKEKFGAGHRVAIIHRLELLPPPSPLLFYSYCDDQEALFKQVAIIFTVHLPVEPSPSLSPKEAEGTVEKYLSNEVWSRVDKDAVAALLSRIADTVVLMNGESSDSMKNNYCS